MFFIKRIFYHQYCAVALISLGLISCALQPPSKGIEWREDKIKHFTVTTLISAGAAREQRQEYRDCRAAGRIIVFTMSIGAGKETYDKYIKKTFWDWGDMTWNLIGSTFGAGLGAHCY
jgi:putative lipoprotein